MRTPGFVTVGLPSLTIIWNVINSIKQGVEGEDIVSAKLRKAKVLLKLKEKNERIIAFQTVYRKIYQLT
jgi:hypothetical protein